MAQIRDWLFVVAALLVAGSGPAGALTTFQGLGDLPGGDFRSSGPAVSGDGRVVVGRSVGAAGFEGFRWEGGQMVGLGVFENGSCARGFHGRPDFCSEARDVSADGSVIVGQTATGSRSVRAFRSEAGTMGLIAMPTPGPSSVVFSEASAVSADGQVVAGEISNADGIRAFRWTESTGAVPLGTIGDVPVGTSRARGISDDGNIVLGESVNPLTTSTLEGFRWESGVMQGLGGLPGESLRGGAWDVSADGSVVVGRAYSATEGQRPVRWVNGVIEALPHLLDVDGLRIGLASAVSADGRVVVGLEGQVIGGNRTAFIWDPENGIRSLQAVLEAELGSQLAGWRLEWATDISADGRTIVGNGINPSGRREAWIATLLPEPHGGWLLGLAVLACRRRAAATRTGRGQATRPSAQLVMPSGWRYGSRRSSGASQVGVWFGKIQPPGRQLEGSRPDSRRSRRMKERR